MIETIDTLDGLARIGDDWNRLARAFPTPLLQHDWFLACAEAFAPAEDVHVLALRRDGVVRAIAPLSVEHSHPNGSLSILGSAVLCEPGGFLYESPRDLEELLGHIVELRQPTHFRRLPASSPEVAMLESKAKGSAFQAERPSGAPWIPIEGEWDAFERRISSKDRYTLRRARRRADAIGQVAFDSRSPGPGEVDAVFDALVRIESLSWKEDRGTSLGTLAPLGRFFRNYMAAAAVSGTLRVSFLTIDGTAVAFLMGVEFAQRMWVLKISFDEAFAHCSPGVLLMHEAIRRAFASRLDAFEFLGTDEPWLHLWTDEVHRYVGVHLYPFSLSGLMHLGSDTSAYLLHRLQPRHHKTLKE
jgi:CelD/BcsL family acetyltransferase involved in cellulose biosynthesis